MSVWDSLERILKAMEGYRWVLFAVAVLFILRDPVTRLIEEIALEAEGGSVELNRKQGLKLEWNRAAERMSEEVEEALSGLDEKSLETLIGICRFNWSIPEAGPNPVYRDAPAWQPHRMLIAARLVRAVSTNPEEVEDEFLRWLVFGPWLWNGDPAWVRFEPTQLGMDACRAWATHLGSLIREPTVLPYRE